MVGELEADILSRVIDPANPTLTPQAAEGILSLTYCDADQLRIQELAAKSTDGTQSEEERREMGGYAFVGDLLALLKSKARQSLRKHGPAAYKPFHNARRRL